MWGLGGHGEESDVVPTARLRGAGLLDEESGWSGEEAGRPLGRLLPCIVSGSFESV